MDLKDVYAFSYDYLIKQSSPYVSQKQIDVFLTTPDIGKCDSLIDAFRMLLIILQDFNRFPQVIKYVERQDTFKSLLHDYDLNYVASCSPETLLEEFRSSFHFEKDALWMRYTKGIVSGAKYLSQFKDYASFKNVCDSYDTNIQQRIKFAKYLSKNIYNMGFAIACNWLKELGYVEYSKPDTHIKDICGALRLASPRDDVECFRAVGTVAQEAGVSAYSVDKVWWLICSGNFYRYDIQIPGSNLKETFIKELIKRF